MSRRTIRPTTRFEIFKRDSFTCQYCGRKAPEVVLEVEHIEPVSKGGSDDLMNLLTACEACNDGKGARRLDDGTVLARQRVQLERLQERREQFKMLLRWRHGLRLVDEENLMDVAAYWNAHTPGMVLNELGHADLRKWLRKYGVEEVLDAMDIAAAQYLERDVEGKVKAEVIGLALGMVPRIVVMRPADATKPYLKDLFYVRKIVENRCHYFDGSQAIELLKDLHAAGADIEELKSIAKHARNWSGWRSDMLAYEDELRTSREQLPIERPADAALASIGGPQAASPAPTNESLSRDDRRYVEMVLLAADALDRARRATRAVPGRANVVVTGVEQHPGTEGAALEHAVRCGDDAALAVLLAITLLGREEREFPDGDTTDGSEWADDEPAETPEEEEEPCTTPADVFDAVDQARVRVRSEGAECLAAYLLSKGPFAAYLRAGLAKLHELGIDVNELVYWQAA